MAGGLESVAHVPVGLVLFTLAAIVAGLYFGIRGMRRARLIEDVPTAKVRSAQQGYVELNGKSVMMGGEPVFAPLSKVNCCWYSYRVEERMGKGWRLVESGTSEAVFILRDATGDCVIDPDGASVTSAYGKTWYAGSYGSGHSTGYQRIGAGQSHNTLFGWLSRHVAIGVGHYRFYETVLLDGDPLYAIGHFHSLRTVDSEQERSQLTATVLRAWKQQPETLLARFDHDRDGHIDMHEWEDARRVAGEQARRQLRDDSQQGPLHTLANSQGRHFLLSNLPEYDLIKRYRWESWLGFAVFLLAGSAASLMLSGL